MLKLIFNEIGDCLCPTFCLGCQRRGNWFCKTCIHESALSLSPTQCQICRRTTFAPNALCKTHQQSLNLKALGCFGSYQKQPLKRALHKLKYQGLSAAFDEFAAHAYSRWQTILKHTSWSALIPIPISPQRLRSRGYNQAFLLARALSELTHIPVRTQLQRIQETRSQVGLSRRERQKNVSGVFKWTGPEIQGPVLLIDDICTTGATLAEAARCLAQAGFRERAALTLAYDEAP
ncbi:ComF family protein [Candidatus Berkelbacteria bacterium]|nr:ComF family protein [Candidatus Berkelbacteria bacterium]